MKQYTTVLAAITIEYDDVQLDEGQVQDNVLQSFPERVGGQDVYHVQFVAGMVNPDGVPIQPRVSREHLLKELL